MTQQVNITPKRKYIIVDLEKCVGCYNCLMACKDEHVGNKWLPYTDEQPLHENKWINPARRERGRYPMIDQCFLTRMCNHCQDAPCAKACPDAVTVREDGIVLISPEKAVGNKELSESCPYGQISWNEELGCAQKCTMCAHLLDQGWKEPRCVAACPLRALKMVEWDDARKAEMVQKLGLQTLTGHDGAVWYRNLHRWKSVFIAGSVACTEGSADTCAAGCKVVLVKDGETVGKKKTDAFGDFKFDKLEPGSGSYTLKLMKPNHPEHKQTVELAEESVYLGTIRLD